MKFNIYDYILKTLKKVGTLGTQIHKCELKVVFIEPAFVNI